MSSILIQREKDLTGVEIQGHAAKTLCRYAARHDLEAQQIEEMSRDIAALALQGELERGAVTRILTSYDAVDVRTLARTFWIEEHQSIERILARMQRAIANIKREAKAETETV